ncbi:sigma-70 family RNA polymerase sigma factor [Sphingomonas cavernae]|uniref:RNA polymerase sigma factor n=1 Tax=Sphingomonas cavernae TaxID=2320861 RepID=A0A418WLH5_9SPHN|nr:sigma-70 family RNA polymerase sigma factor [Sphingomonas cavernae]RJF90901.1 sigma-70 family RNA polymerase sigma factor [Sphingomonas cavernae]
MDHATRKDGADEARAQLTAALARVAAEDRAALRDVYDRTSAKLFGICLRISQDRQGAEDILQEVYVSVWKRAGSFDPKRASPITWLATIARNRAIDWKRAQGRRQAEPVETALQLADDRPLAPELLIAEEERRRLADCLEMLETRHEQAIRRAFFDGLTYAELAERMDVPLGTMKSWIRRGLMRLKDCLDNG